MTQPRPTTNRIFTAEVQLFQIPIPLGVTQVAPDATPQRQPFIVTTPSARLLTSLSVIFWQQVTGQPTPIPAYMDATLGQRIATGLFAAVANKTAAGNYAPVGNLVGTVGPSRAAPAATFQTVPVDNDGVTNTLATLSGYSIDVQSGQDAIIGIVQNQVLQFLSTPIHGMNISLRARWESVGTDICDDEWAVLKSRMAITAAPAIVYQAF